MPRAMRSASFKALLAMLAALSLNACAGGGPVRDKEAAAEAAENNDPFESANRVFYAVNDGLDIVLLRPLAVTYRAAVPGVVRRPVGNALSNLNNPVIFANDVMQGKPGRAGNTAMRLLVNTTLGVGGLFDVAGHNGFPAHDNDFGLTLALWGVPSGPFLFLPVLGPSNPRDATGFGVDIALDPITWPSNGGGFNAFRISRSVLDAVDTREKALDVTQSIKRTSLDPYATYRSLYQQHRQSVVDELNGSDSAPLPPQPIIGTQTPH
jgi:phospholipid-binding lipoprotein MlaA